MPKKRCHFNSQPREGGWKLQCVFIHLVDDFNSQPREGGWAVTISFRLLRTEFQLTAARRRLECSANVARLSKGHFNSQPREGGWFQRLKFWCLQSISTHSRAKAAGRANEHQSAADYHFNSQPREGGWFADFAVKTLCLAFQLTAARRRLAVLNFPQT